MGFYDLPIVDTAAENSARSVNALRQHFQEGNGFIAREDIPDKGCDFMIEIIEKNQSTNCRFPVQLKSVENPVTILDGRYISYPFELSRLKYLLDYKPVVGMVVFYAVKEDKFYFEFAETIYYRLKDGHPDDTWKQQDKANIHIPIENELTPLARQNIHNFMSEIFKRHAQMYQEQALGYSLPSIDPVHKPEAGKDLPERSANTLRLKGLELFLERKISYLDKLLGQVPNQVIVNDPEMAVIAAMTYHEMGLYIDAEYYLSKSLHKKDLKPFYKQSATWTKIKNDYLLNKTDYDTYIKQGKELRDTLEPGDRPNRLMFEINVVRHQILGNHPLEPIPQEVEKQILAMHDEIIKLDTVTANRHNLQIMNTENLGLFIHRMGDHLLRRVLVMEANGHPDTEYHKKQSFEYLVPARINFSNMVNELISTAQKKGDLYLEAQAMTVYTRHMLGTEFTLLDIRGIEGSIAIDKTGKRLFDHFNYCIAAGNLYIGLHQYIKAYGSFCNALEFLSILRHCSLPLHYPEEELTANVEKLRDRLQLPAYELQTPKLIAHHNTNLQSRQSTADKTGN